MADLSMKSYLAFACNLFLAVPLLTFYALALTGAIPSSPSILDVFLVQLQSRDNGRGGAPAFVVSVGYFEICAGFSGHLACTQSSKRTASDLTEDFDTNASLLTSEVARSYNPLTTSLFQFALVLQSKLFLWLPAVSGVLFFIDLFLNAAEVLRLVKRKYGTTAKASQGRLRRISRTVDWTSTALALAATTGIIQPSGSLQFMSDSFSSQIRVTVGKTAQALRWLIVVFSFKITLGKTMVQPGSGDGSGQSASKSGAKPPAAAKPIGPIKKPLPVKRGPIAIKG